MKLSNDLISQFVKVTNDKTESKQERTAYATVVIYNEKTYVKIDGSDLLTPVDSTVTVKDGERVSVEITNHKATIIGNYTDPSASSKDLIKVTEDLNGYKIEVGETYTEKTEFNQLKDKFTWIVKSGDSISTMELTDEMYNVISKNITLTADRINLNGYISNDDSNWSIDQEGNLNVNNINIEGDISCDSINFKDIKNPKILQCLNESLELLVNADTGNDDWTIDDILESYDREDITSIKIIYTQYINTITFKPTTMNLLPIEIDTEGYDSQIQLEPDGQTVIRRLVLLYISSQVFDVILQAQASEQASRRAAMDSANRNADGLIDQLRLKYNQARQAAITQEMNEIAAATVTENERS